MRLLLLPAQDEDCRIPHRALGEGLWQSRSHPEEEFLLWLPLIRASLLALFKASFLNPPFVVGPSSQPWGQDGFQGQSQKGHSEGHRLPASPFSSVLTQGPTDAGTNWIMTHKNYPPWPQWANSVYKLDFWELETKNWEALSARFRVFTPTECFEGWVTVGSIPYARLSSHLGETETPLCPGGAHLADLSCILHGREGWKPRGSGSHQHDLCATL